MMAGPRAAAQRDRVASSVWVATRVVVLAALVALVPAGLPPRGHHSGDVPAAGTHVAADALWRADGVAPDAASGVEARAASWLLGVGERLGGIGVAAVAEAAKAKKKHRKQKPRAPPRAPSHDWDVLHDDAQFADDDIDELIDELLDADAPPGDDDFGLTLDSDGAVASDATAKQPGPPPAKTKKRKRSGAAAAKDRKARADGEGASAADGATMSEVDVDALIKDMRSGSLDGAVGREMRAYAAQECTAPAATSGAHLDMWRPKSKRRMPGVRVERTFLKRRSEGYMGEELGDTDDDPDADSATRLDAALRELRRPVDMGIEGDAIKLREVIEDLRNVEVSPEFAQMRNRGMCHLLAPTSDTMANAVAAMEEAAAADEATGGMSAGSDTGGGGDTGDAGVDDTDDEHLFGYDEEDDADDDDDDDDDDGYVSHARRSRLAAHHPALMPHAVRTYRSAQAKLDEVAAGASAAFRAIARENATEHRSGESGSTDGSDGGDGDDDGTDTGLGEDAHSLLYPSYNFGYSSVFFHGWLKLMQTDVVHEAVTFAAENDMYVVVLGSGLGSTVFFSALTFGVETVGYELSYTLVSAANRLRDDHSVYDAHFVHADVLTADLAGAAVVWVHNQHWAQELTLAVMDKLARELPRGAIIIAVSELPFKREFVVEQYHDALQFLGYDVLDASWAKSGASYGVFKVKSPRGWKQWKGKSHVGFGGTYVDVPGDARVRVVEDAATDEEADAAAAANAPTIDIEDADDDGGDGSSASDGRKRAAQAVVAGDQLSRWLYLHDIGQQYAPALRELGFRTPAGVVALATEEHLDAIDMPREARELFWRAVRGQKRLDDLSTRAEGGVGEEDIVDALVRGCLDHRVQQYCARERVLDPRL